MKTKISIRLLAILMLFLMTFCFGCDVVDNAADETKASTSDETTAEGTTEETQMKENTEASKFDVDLTDEQATLENADFRILLTSDMHHTYLETNYNLSTKARMNAWVKAIKKEHEKRPFDLIVIMGDMSLDFWDDQWGKPVGNPGGSYLNSGTSTTKEFVDNYVSKLPEDIPVFVKEGTLLPLAEPISCVAPDTQFAITLRAYGDCSDSVCRLIEDDGVTVGAPMKVLCVNADTASLDSHRYRITGFEQIGN